MVADGEIVPQHVELLADPHRSADGLHVVSDVITLDFGCPCSGSLDPSQNVESGGFACSIVSEQTEDLVVLDFE